MPTTPRDAHRRRWAALLVAALLPLTGCFASDSPDDPGVPQEQARVDVAGDMQQVLRARARALRGRDLERFLATTTRARGFTQRERRYFTNLSQLPIGRLSYDVDPETVVRTEGGYRAVVDMRLQLHGYDAVPVVRPQQFRFVDDPDGAGLVVASDRDPRWERRSEVSPQPWDTGSIVVRSGAGVLGIFDEASAAVAGDVIRAVEAGIASVAAEVPYDWSRMVVVYALSDAATLQGLGDVPGGDPDSLDAIAFPVLAHPGDGVDQLASTRFMLHPRMLGSEPGQLARLIRHELTHVALGARDDLVPTWLSEGIAEWVSVQPIPPEERLISGAALEAAEQGPAALPNDIEFNGPDQGAHYGLSWWACETVVDMYGEEMLWRLLDELAATSPPDQSDKLQQLLQMGTGQLAREAANRILATYR
ncbi:hypothetical protein DDE18_05845 [Nocardioides gansuensis]|uniref:Peptidase MA-like domain-containing protein n=1 Tax=Nocardioides gansuensis TaxID=2138300 RepID=A0A2T8FDP1_9ACTN|nr:hypothetical protein [Nocardioides gansuensis]PVG83826.1 hypothetical protein DDE18_05845 [Nocardioides gansuensis]